jgi:hypothetical protein
VRNRASDHQLEIRPAQALWRDNDESRACSRLDRVFGTHWTEQLALHATNFQTRERNSGNSDAASYHAKVSSNT